MTWGIASLVGSLIGGNLSHPADKYPNLFGHISLFRERPYFLPCLVSALITFAAMICVAVFLEETVPSKASIRHSSFSTRLSAKREPLASAEAALLPESLPIKPTTLQLLREKPIQKLLLTGFLVSFISWGYEIVFVLWAYTPAKLGGLARTSSEIGYVLAAAGLSGMCLSLVVFPAIYRKVEPLPLFIFLMAMWPVLFVAPPILGYLAKMTPENANTDHLTPLSGWVWLGVAVMMISGRMAGMTYASNNIMVKIVATNYGSVAGSIYGLSQSVGSVAEAFGPAFISSLFALSVDKRLLGGNLVWLVMVGISVWGVVATRNLRNV